MFKDLKRKGNQYLITNHNDSNPPLHVGAFKFMYQACYIYNSSCDWLVTVNCEYVVSWSFDRTKLLTKLQPIFVFVSLLKHWIWCNIKCNFNRPTICHPYLLNNTKHILTPLNGNWTAIPNLDWVTRMPKKYLNQPKSLV